MIKSEILENGIVFTSFLYNMDCLILAFCGKNE